MSNVKFNELDERKLTEEQKEMVKNVLRDSVDEEDKYLRSLPSNGGDLVNEDLPPEQVEATAKINPSTGLAYLERSEEEKKIDKEMAKLLDVSVEDLYTIPESLDEIPIDEDLVAKNASSYGIDASDMSIIIDLIHKYRRKEDINYYFAMPENVQKMINAQCMQLNNSSMEARKMFAEEILQGLIRDAGIDRTVIDFQHSMETAFDVSPLMSMTLEFQKTQLEINLEKIANKLMEENTEESNAKAKQLFDIRDAYKESYMLTGLLDDIKSNKVKVKDFDVSKYARFCRNFNCKYEKDTPFIIHDISICVPILKRKYPEYEPRQLARFIIAFMMHSKNKDSRNVVDHTYMSYFISNIKNLDFISKKSQSQVDFIKLFMSNIDKCIRAINKLPEREYIITSAEILASDNKSKEPS